MRLRTFLKASLACWLLAGGAVAAPPPPAPAAPDAQELRATLNGHDHEPLAAVRVAGKLLLNVKEAGELFGAQVTWYPVSGRVRLGWRGSALELVAGSTQASLGGQPLALDAPVQLRAAQAFAPLSLFLSRDFAELSGLDSRLDSGAQVLVVERRTSVGSVRWYSYRDFTRVVLELKKPLGHTASKRGGRVLEVTLPFGVIDAPQTAQVGDGFIEQVSLRQDSQAARWSVTLAKPGLRWRVRELDAPKRLALEVAAADPAAVAGDDPAAPAPAGAPALSTAPAAVSASESAPGRRRIVVDAGHGGKDSGATGRRGTREKDVNLAVAKELAKRLAKDKRFEVLLTRDDDTFVPLDQRSRLSNDSHADLFVSLHCNAHRNGKEHGFEVYFMSETASDPEAERLAAFENSSLELEGKTPADAQADLILHAMTKEENINAASELAALVTRGLHKQVDLEPRGVKQAGFYVLRGTDAPAVLIELAFLSNRKDEAKLGSKGYRSRLVDGIYAGLLDYAKRAGWLDKGARVGVR